MIRNDRDWNEGARTSACSSCSRRWACWKLHGSPCSAVSAILFEMIPGGPDNAPLGDFRWAARCFSRACICRCIFTETRATRRWSPDARARPADRDDPAPRLRRFAAAVRDQLCQPHRRGQAADDGRFDIVLEGWRFTVVRDSTSRRRSARSRPRWSRPATSEVLAMARRRAGDRIAAGASPRAGLCGPTGRR